MTETVAIDLGDGSMVTAEVIGELQFQSPPEQGASGYGDVGFGVNRSAAQLGSAVALTLDQVRGTVQGIGRWAAETIIQGDAGAPDAFEVEFGLKLAVKSGQLLGIIAEAGSEAGLTIRLSWNAALRRERGGTPPGPAPSDAPTGGG
ncbi:CU044_2847 family protein [Streptomyces sp. NPDC048349]|uniref:CU044_2847 family protein n=1 Tax=Streptomyces sp. NPDC048349 TaxID=3155486 RepID=UPI0034488B39